MLSPVISQKFKFWSFISMLLLVYVHGYNLNLRYLQPWTIPGEPLTFTSFTEYFLANGIFRFRIPMLFIISGYLYALHDDKPYGQRTKKRLKTLLLPYLIWSAFGLALTYALEMFAYTRGLVISSHIMQIDDTRMLLHDYKWYEWLARWILIPVPYQLWFIRVLLIYNIAYPPIKWCVTHKYAKWIFFAIALLLWLSTSGFIIIEGEGLLFFSLGILLQKNKFDIEHPKKWLQPIIWLPVFIILAAIKTWLAFKGENVLGNSIYPVLTILHKLVVVSGLVAMWYSCDGLVKWCMNKKWFVVLSAFAFIIYAMHAPMVAYAIDGVFAWLQPLQGYRMITFIFLPMAVILWCMVTGALLKKFAPTFYSLLTGGRGI